MDEIEMIKMGQKMDDLAFRLIMVICEKPDFGDFTKTSDESLYNMLFLLNENEKYEQSSLVLNEIKTRGLSIDKKSQYEVARTLRGSIKL